MKYVALLRGINVGGNNKIDMKSLKQSFESVGMDDVLTYINSGNIIFSTTISSREKIIDTLQKVIQRDFKLFIKVLLRSFSEIETVVKAIPQDWRNDQEMKSDVLFLQDEIDNKEILDKFTIKEGIDTVFYEKGTIFWHIDKKNLSKTGLALLPRNKDLYTKITIRNVNTTRKIFELMSK